MAFSPKIHGLQSYPPNSHAYGIWRWGLCEKTVLGRIMIVGPRDGISGFREIRGNLTWSCSVLLVELLLCDKAVSTGALLKYKTVTAPSFWDHKSNKAILNKLPFCLWHCVIITEDR